MSPQVAGVLVVLLSAIVSGFTALITSRATAHKSAAETRVIDAKLPPEVDSIVVQGAEAAVITMQKALDASNQERAKDQERATAERAKDRARIKELEKERDEDRRRIKELEAKVSKLEAKVETAEEAVAEARAEGRELRQELGNLINDQNNRK